MSSSNPGQRIILASAVAVAAATVFYLLRSKKRLLNRFTVVEMHVFPVKSCGGMAVTSANLLPTGFEYDREWAIIRKSDAKVMTMRELSFLKKLFAFVNEEQRTLALRFPGKADVTIPLGWNASAVGEEQHVALWDVQGTVRPFGDASVHEWLTAVINENLPADGQAQSYFLGRIGSVLRNTAGTKHASIVPAGQCVALQDFSSVHITSVSSIDAVRAAVGDPTLNSLRFRANLVVDGGAAHDEDTWDEFSVGSVQMKTARLCGRCAIPTINDAGERNPAFMPTRYLREARYVYYTHRPPSDAPQAMFGIAVFQSGPPAAGSVTIRVGDAVTVSTRRAPPVFVS